MSSKKLKTGASHAALTRRDLLKVGLGGAAVSMTGMTPAWSRDSNARGHIVIVGAGAGGLALANRLARRLPMAEVSLVDSKPQHWYQPGLTMVASGVWRADEVISDNQRWVPSGINWIQARVTRFEAEDRRLQLDSGDTLNYDYLVVATGLQVNYEDVEGFSADMIGQHGIGCVYDTPDHAAKTNQVIADWIDSGGGTGLFIGAPGAVKCAGAPLKMTFTTLSRLEDTGHRDQYDVHFASAGDRVFAVDFYNDFVLQRWQEQGVERHDHHPLRGIDASARRAWFDTPDGERSMDYDFIHIVPPMSAPDVVRESDLVWTDGPFAGNWLEVDQYTMQHRRYPEVFGLGDVIGAPINKTAASVKAQAPVVEENLVAVMNDREPTAEHNGYTSCPLITGIGKAMLAEFGYGNVLLPSFPFIDPKDESWAVWIMKDRMLKPAYYAMLDGRV
ncbi:MAG: NAD(P)/FAD-dependent oxidoreductase [Natronospirillum sp.]|uniref:NAD(P)/FAD-dependent oxidoreductase n=1 Tax=Natronospirillum sp. TaxID=2812955 RepID=UPI0025DB0A4C|nr:FAD/NAD(P)-binding oxidoreductase [Natronospirillum sp.]MCH8550287.1 NAD(P)/FAD-dependent oxidoreductase [Natronospirillum sp.]